MIWWLLNCTQCVRINSYPKPPKDIAGVAAPPVAGTAGAPKPANAGAPKPANAGAPKPANAGAPKPANEKPATKRIKQIK